MVGRLGDVRIALRHAAMTAHAPLLLDLRGGCVYCRGTKVR